MTQQASAAHCSAWYPLFEHMSKNHGLTLLDDELSSIASAADESRMKAHDVFSSTSDMNAIKIDLCRKHWQHLSPEVREHATAKHLLAATEIAERLICENNKLEMENRTLRMMPNDPDQRPGAKG